MAKRRSWVETAKAVYPGETELADLQHRADQAEARVAELAAALRAADAWMDECVDYIEWDHFTRGVEDRHDAARSAVAAALARLDAAGGDKGPDASAPDPS